MLEIFTASFVSLLSVEHLSFLLFGVLLGLAVGIFPGLGGIAGLSLLLPFLYGMEQTSALAMLIGLVAVIPTSDTFTSVLMGIPGSSGSQATVIDGFPLAKKGEAARALSAAFSASLFGGLFGAAILTAFVLIARPVILAFGSAELFMLTLLGLSMVGVLAGNSLIKGLSTCGLGVLFGTIGSAPATGEFRMTFELDYLMDGLPLVVVGLGIFAVPEIVDLMRQNRAISEASDLGDGWFAGIKDLVRHKWLALRCALLGCLVGALPGLGGSVVDWIAYGHAVQSSKDKENFGKGDIRGVIAPEASNNAKEGGALIPTLLFGIPGSGGMAVFLGGMILIGLEPGPSMVTTDLNITYTIIWSLALANVIGAGACLFLSRWVAKLTTIPYALMAPFMITVITFAAFQATRDLGDLTALLAVGILGIFLKRFNWPRPAFLIGFVLASGMENYLYQAVQFDGWSFLTRPGVLIIASLIGVSVFVAARQSQKNNGSQPPAPTDQTQALSVTGKAPQLIFASSVWLLFAYGLYDAFHVTELARIFPAGVCLTMLVLTTVVITQLLRNTTGNGVYFDEELTAYQSGKTESLYHYIYWLAGLIAACYLFGYIVSISVFFTLFLHIKAHKSWLSSMALAASMIGFIVALSYFMVLDLPIGLLQDALGLG